MGQCWFLFTYLYLSTIRWAKRSQNGHILSQKVTSSKNDPKHGLAPSILSVGKSADIYAVY
jgi:hypothetical protein